MSHLPDIALKTWKRGDGLDAAGLNANFAALLDLIETAMATALTPDPVGRALEPRVAALDDRLERLEHLLSLHARQRNELEVTPLAYTAQVMQLVSDLRGPLTERAQRLERTYQEALLLHDGHAVRLAGLEAAQAANIEAHEAIAQVHAELGKVLKMVLEQLAGLRQEIAYTRKLAEGIDRQANRLEFAPLAMVAHLLQRIMTLETRFPSNE